MSRRRALLAVVVLALLTVNLVISASSGGRSDKAVLAGNGIGTTRFGAGRAVTLRTLASLMGSPANEVVQDNATCDFTESAAWAGKKLFVLFDYNGFVGYGYSGNRLTTAAGLKVGDRLSRAQKLYGHKLSVSAVQGGAWFVKTAAGRLDGYLKEVPRTTNPKYGVLPDKNRILSIGAGNQGCPAMAP